MIYFTDLLQDDTFRKSAQDYLQQKSGNSAYHFEKSFPKLYHYRKLTDYLIDDIINKKMTLSSIYSFNDVFDSTVQIYNTEEDIENAVNKNIQKDQELGIAIDKDFYKEYFKEESELKFSLLDYLGTYVKCFSTINNSSLMWSHYADSNKGICIEYDFNNLKSPIQKSMLFPVLYTQEPMKLQDLFEDNKREVVEYPIDTAVLCSALNKCDIWKYEHEWRIVFSLGLSDNPQRGEIITALNPTAIYMGNSFLKDFFCYGKTDNKPCEKITLLLQLLEYIEQQSIQLFFMMPQQGTFTLKAKAVDINIVKYFLISNFRDKKAKDVRFYYSIYKQFLRLIDN